MTMTRAWWIVAGGMIIAGTVAVDSTDMGPDVHQMVKYLTYAVLLFGLAIVAFGVVQVTRVAVRALGQHP